MVSSVVEVLDKFAFAVFFWLFELLGIDPSYLNRCFVLPML